MDPEYKNNLIQTILKMYERAYSTDETSSLLDVIASVSSSDETEAIKTATTATIDSWWGYAINQYEEAYGVADLVDPADFKFTPMMIRRILPRLVASDIIGVQPMTIPTGKVIKIKT
jgi:hypothetical protein